MVSATNWDYLYWSKLKLFIFPDTVMWITWQPCIKWSPWTENFKQWFWNVFHSVTQSWKLNKLIVTWCHHMASEILVNIRSGNGLIAGKEGCWYDGLQTLSPSNQCDGDQAVNVMTIAPEVCDRISEANQWHPMRSYCWDPMRTYRYTEHPDSMGIIHKARSSTTVHLLENEYTCCTYIITYGGMAPTECGSHMNKYISTAECKTAVTPVP